MLDLQFIEDIAEAFKPMVKFVAAKGFEEGSAPFNKIMAKWMYMYSDDSHSFFKNIDTRSYLKLPRK